MNRPIPGNITKCKLNATLHGRSVHRQENVSGHNVFMGYTDRDGDGLDVFVRAGTDVYAMHGGRIIDLVRTGKKARVMIASAKEKSMYAHINPKPYFNVGSSVKAGQLIGYVGDLLDHPHLHLEIWVDGKAISAPKAKELAEKIQDLITR